MNALPLTCPRCGSVRVEPLLHPLCALPVRTAPREAAKLARRDWHCHTCRHHWRPEAANPAGTAATIPTRGALPLAEDWLRGVPRERALHGWTQARVERVWRAIERALQAPAPHEGEAPTADPPPSFPPACLRLHHPAQVLACCLEHAHPRCLPLRAEHPRPRLFAVMCLAHAARCGDAERHSDSVRGREALEGALFAARWYLKELIQDESAALGQWLREHGNGLTGVAGLLRVLAKHQQQLDGLEGARRSSAERRAETRRSETAQWRALAAEQWPKAPAWDNTRMAEWIKSQTGTKRALSMIAKRLAWVKHKALRAVHADAA